MRNTPAALSPALSPAVSPALSPALSPAFPPAFSPAFSPAVDPGRRRWLAGAVAAWAGLAGCGGGDATDQGGPPPGPAGLRSVERIATPWTEQDRPATLEQLVWRPAGNGPFPTLVFHHGSTGSGQDPGLFRLSFEALALAREFNARGWMVLFPQRRGRGQSDGQYQEGLAADGSGYACTAAPALAGWERALQDVDVITAALRARADIDASRLVVGGHSRGGALALAHAASAAGTYRGVLNFVGGWLGERCVDALPVSEAIVAQAARATAPSLWLYGANDPFYSLEVTRGMFERFVGLGGQGRYQSVRRSQPTASGHLIHEEPALWIDDVVRFLMLPALSA